MADPAIIQLVLNGRLVVASDVPPTRTVLDWLRDDLGLRGTKEGCAEGDCGACTVLLEQADADGRLHRQAINSCLVVLGQVDGKGVRTVEGLVESDRTPHPLQTAMAEGYATQCGFCTPGFVMSAVALGLRDEQVTVKAIHDTFAGNLCRCTGYRPIVDTIVKSLPLGQEPLRGSEPALLDLLSALGRETGFTSTEGERRFWAPRSLDELLAMRATHPEAILLAGGTDLGLLASRDRRPPEAIIHLSHVPELATISDEGREVSLGAAVTYTSALPMLAKHFPTLQTYLSRLGSMQIRNMGTLGGNIGTASPIGDFLPLLLALDAELTLCSQASGERRLPLEGFFLGYRKTALRPDEIVKTIHLPKLAPGDHLFADKISKRRDQDISAVCAAYRVRLDGARIVDVRLAYGGMAAIPKRAAQAEAALQGREWDETAIATAAAALPLDFTPLSDARASGEYRSLVAANLLTRFYWRVTGSDAPVEIDAA